MRKFDKDELCHHIRSKERERRKSATNKSHTSLGARRLGRDHLDEIDNVGMVERLENLNLANGRDREPFLLIVHAHFFQRHHFARRFLAGQVHFSISPLSHLLQLFENVDCSANGEAGVFFSSFLSRLTVATHGPLAVLRHHRRSFHLLIGPAAPRSQAEARSLDTKGNT